MLIDNKMFARWLHDRLSEENGSIQEAKKKARDEPRKQGRLISLYYVKEFMKTMPSYGALEKVGQRTENMEPTRVAIGQLSLSVYGHKQAQQFMTQTAGGLVQQTQIFVEKLELERRRVDAELQEANQALNEFGSSAARKVCFCCNPGVLVPLYVIILVYGIVAYLGSTIGISGPKVFCTLCGSVFLGGAFGALTEYKFGSQLEKLQKIALLFEEYNRLLKKSIAQLAEYRSQLRHEVTYVKEELEDMNRYVNKFDNLRQELEELYKERKNADIINLVGELDELLELSKEVMKGHYLNMYYDVTLACKSPNKLDKGQYKKFCNRLSDEEKKAFKHKMGRRSQYDSTQFIDLVVSKAIDETTFNLTLKI
ncbi:hypothetical protein RFI_25416 [Reticulomyxa filosa]|uniref:Uncharacterized protein n=1 Tax=Reticulomyxa filosa TaxID=46433 RepID=X6ME84_RETFI|nr:hypothetical protein RFI_25416 [Reticulomyxa filosa]|eukprot:ETO11956.1 hypothetical protein RFI_25416 [Reticulomyxa filosa]